MHSSAQEYRSRRLGIPGYEVHYSLAEHILRQRRSIVLDNPVFRRFVEERSLEVAWKTGATWSMIECACPDLKQLDNRLARRLAMGHQSRIRNDWRAKAGTSAPLSDRFLLDTRDALDTLVERAVAYIESRPASRNS